MVQVKVPAVVGVPASSLLASRGSEKVCRLRPGGSFPLVTAQVNGAAPPLRKKLMAKAWPTVPGNSVEPLAGSTTVSGWFGSTVIEKTWYRGWPWSPRPAAVKV